MKKQFLLSVSLLFFSLGCLTFTNVTAQEMQPATLKGVDEMTQAKMNPQSNLKQLTRAQFNEMAGDAQQNILEHPEIYQISDLVNATPSALLHRQDNLFYIPVADFNGLSMERKWAILKNPSTYLIVQDATAIPKIEITKEQLNALPAEKRAALRNSSDYIIVE